MTPRQARLGVDLYTAAMVASVAMALAGLTWRLLGDPGVGLAVAPVVSRGAAADDIGPVVALAPFGTAAAPVVAGPVSSAVQLRGILMAVPAEASVALIANEGGTVSSYGIGSSVAGGVIEAIRADQVAIRTSGGVRILTFTPAGGPASGSENPQAPAQPAPSAGGASPSPPPVTTGPAGYVVSAVPAPQLVAAGLRPGDVITQLNGTPVGSGANERDLMARAAAMGQAQIEVIRDGRRVSLNVPFR